MFVPIQVTADFICPWCHIGAARLHAAAATMPARIALRIDWQPFELNADMPPGGMDRRAYRTLKFGSLARSRAMDAQVAEAGRADGLRFDFASIRRTPNTFLAHRVAWLARCEGKQDDFVQAVFQAYFAEGRDIGAAEVLVDLAVRAGLDRDTVAGYLDGDGGAARVRALEHGAAARGIDRVPVFDIGGTPIVGAQSVDTLHRAMLDAATWLAGTPSA